MQVTLSKCVVTLKDELTWGDSQDINAETQAALMVNMKTLEQINQRQEADGTVRLDSKALLASAYKAAELIIVKIVNTDGTEVPYSKEWFRGLSVSDGSLLTTHLTLVQTGNGSAKK